MEEEETEVIEFAYETGVIPEVYGCSRCKATGCKLWRGYQDGSPIQFTKVMCVNCACYDQGKDPADVDGSGHIKITYYPGTMQRYEGRTLRIGHTVPAIILPDLTAYYPVDAAPPKGSDWWETLPTLPVS